MDDRAMSKNAKAREPGTGLCNGVSLTRPLEHMVRFVLTIDLVVQPCY